MSTTRQGMSSAEIQQIIAQRVTNAIEAIAIYETKICMAHKSTDRVETNIQKKDKNKAKWTKPRTDWKEREKVKVKVHPGT
ncbi:hypothetical protein Tco_0636252 [Tanacetum coccineum]